jgi:hypothetical protein
MIATLMRMIRWTLMTLIAFGLLLYSSGPWVVAPDAHAQGGPTEIVIAIVGIVVGVLTTAVATAVALPKDKPGIHIDEFSLAVADDFNVGDCGTINLQISVSYGSISDYLSGEETGRVSVQFFADGELIGEKEAEQTGEPVIRSYTFKANIIGTRPGSINVTAKISVSGQISGTINDEWTLVEQETPTRVVNVAEPYEVWIDGPRPNEITHGETKTAKLKARVRTQDAEHNCASAKGLIGYPTQLDGQQAPIEWLRGANNAGHSYETDLVVRKKSHEGCPYEPPHPPFVNLPFQPNSYELYAFFAASPYKYMQQGDLEPVYARDYPLGQPTCPEGEKYDPDQCKCVKKTRFSFTVPVGTGGTCKAKTPALGSIQISEIWATLTNCKTGQPLPEGTPVTFTVNLKPGKEKPEHISDIESITVSAPGFKPKEVKGPFSAVKVSIPGPMPITIQVINLGTVCLEPQ